MFKAILQRKIYWLFGAVLVGGLLAFSFIRLRSDLQPLSRYDALFGGSRKVWVAVHPRSGTIYTPSFFKTYEKIAQEVFLLPGMDRTSATSLFMPNVRTLEWVDEGFRGESIIPSSFGGTAEELVLVRERISRSPSARRLVGVQESAALITGSVMENVSGISSGLEKIRQTYQSETMDVLICGVPMASGVARGLLRSLLICLGLSILLNGTAAWLCLRRRSKLLSRMLLTVSVGPFVWAGAVSMRAADTVLPGFLSTRPCTRYSQDFQAMNDLFPPGLNVYILWAEQAPGTLLTPTALKTLDTLSWELRQLPGVKAVFSLPDYSRVVQSVYMEGHPKWRGTPRQEAGLKDTLRGLDPKLGLISSDGNVMPFYVFLTDLRSGTLKAVSEGAEELVTRLNTPELRFRLAGGNAGLAGVLYKRLGSRIGLTLVGMGVVLGIVFLFLPWVILYRTDPTP